jgi:hypothetical protein
LGNKVSRPGNIPQLTGISVVSTCPFPVDCPAFRMLRSRQDEVFPFDSFFSVGMGSNRTVSLSVFPSIVKLGDLKFRARLLPKTRLNGLNIPVCCSYRCSFDIISQPLLTNAQSLIQMTNLACTIKRGLEIRCCLANRPGV